MKAVMRSFYFFLHVVIILPGKLFSGFLAHKHRKSPIQRKKNPNNIYHIKQIYLNVYRFIEWGTWGLSVEQRSGLNWKLNLLINLNTHTKKKINDCHGILKKTCLCWCTKSTTSPLHPETVRHELSDHFRIEASAWSFKINCESYFNEIQT